MSKISTYILLTALMSVSADAAETPSRQQKPPETDVLDGISERLRAGYPGIVVGIKDNRVLFQDGTTLPYDDSKSNQTLKDWLANPSIADMFELPYSAGHPIDPPGVDDDAGRARNEAFFNKVYGDCATGEVSKSLVNVIWLLNSDGRPLKFNARNGAADALRRVSKALDELPPEFQKYLIPPAGTYNCRRIAGTNRRSAHSYGIAIDIATKTADYWRWSANRNTNNTKSTEPRAKPNAPEYRNRLPERIVRIFEEHGFIWGGRWYHFDTMHFEYRPELFPIKSKSHRNQVRPEQGD